MDSAALLQYCTSAAILDPFMPLNIDMLTKSARQRAGEVTVLIHGLCMDQLADIYNDEEGQPIDTRHKQRKQ